MSNQALQVRDLLVVPFTNSDLTHYQQSSGSVASNLQSQRANRAIALLGPI
jgi:hypothetical protein